MLLCFGLHVSRVGQSLASLSPFQEPLVVSVVLSLTSVACVASISLVASVTSVASVSSVSSVASGGSGSVGLLDSKTASEWTGYSGITASNGTDVTSGSCGMLVSNLLLKGTIKDTYHQCRQDHLVEPHR